jgi:hypothetical protein
MYPVVITIDGDIVFITLGFSSLFMNTHSLLCKFNLIEFLFVVHAKRLSL